MTVLITAGASREPIDAVRFLSNIGTGATGVALAEALAARGHRVVVLRGMASAVPGTAIESEGFSSAEDLHRRLQDRLARGDIDAVIMTAAVADYRPRIEAAGKMGSEAAALTLSLVRNPKLLPLLKSYSPRPLAVAGFKLTVGADPAARRAAVAAQFGGGGVDLVVHNDLDEIRRGPIHPFWIYRTPQARPVKAAGTAALAVTLEKELIDANARCLHR